MIVSGIALIVLGPEKLPRVASQVGRWVGRARTMARQFKEQLEEEVNLEEVRKAHKAAESKPAPPAADSKPTPPPGADGSSPPIGEATAPGTPDSPPNFGATSPDPASFTADTFSHAHPTDEFGANPLTPSGGPPPETVSLPQSTAPTEMHSVPDDATSSAAQPAAHEGFDPYSRVPATPAGSEAPTSVLTAPSPHEAAAAGQQSLPFASEASSPDSWPGPTTTSANGKPLTADAPRRSIGEVADDSPRRANGASQFASTTPALGTPSAGTSADAPEPTPAPQSDNHGLS